MYNNSSTFSIASNNRTMVRQMHICGMHLYDDTTKVKNFKAFSSFFQIANLHDVEIDNYRCFI